MDDRPIAGYRKRWLQKAQNDSAPAPTSAIQISSSDEDVAVISSPQPAERLCSVESAKLECDHVQGLVLEEDTTPPKRQRIRFFDFDEEPQGIQQNVGSPLNQPASSAASLDLLRVTDTHQFKYPWERGPLAKIFDTGCKHPALKLPGLMPGGRNLLNVDINLSGTHGVGVELNMKSPQVGKCIFKDVIKASASSHEVQERDAKRLAAIDKWVELLAIDLNCSAVGVRALEEHGDSWILDCLKEIVDASFGVKSPGTLMKRHYSIKSFAEWCTTRNQDWLPLSEKNAWLYVRNLREVEAPATKAVSFIEACRFVHHVLGVHGAGEIECSLRVRGLASQLHLGKAPWKPADLLTVSEVAILHQLLGDSNRNIGDRVFAGHFLHLLYSRSRWSDLCFVRDWEIDDQCKYLEVKTNNHKGAKSSDLKTRLLPIVAPCVGATGQNWAVLYEKVRGSGGLPNPQKIAGPLLTAPYDDTGLAWSERVVTSQEGSDMLRKLLNAPKTKDRRVSSHSLKATSLSWCSKVGLDNETRSVLGRHASSVKDPLALYSRDLILPSLRSFDFVLNSIKNKSFQPDLSRSGMVTPVPRQPEETAAPFTPGLPRIPAMQKFVEEPQFDAVSLTDHEPSMENDIGEKSRFEHAPSETADLDNEVGSFVTDESSESSSEAQTSGSEERQLIDPPACLETASADLTFHYINEKTLVVHVPKTREILRCGRKISLNMRSSFEKNGIKCSGCFTENS